LDTKDGNETANLLKKGVSLINKNIIVFAFFLFFSFIFWYLNSLGKDLEADIRYPVKYTNIPAKRNLTPSMPSRLNLSMRGPGYSILKLKISGSSSPLVIDFSKISYRHAQINRAEDYYILTPALLQNFNSQIRSACKITSVKPDTLFFSFRPAAR
jgi:hypothetical protein